MLLLVTDMQR